MTIPSFSFAALAWGQIRDVWRGETKSGAIAQSRYTVITTFGNNQLRSRIEFARAQVRPWGPYALETQLVGQSSATRTYGFGTGELLVIEPPEFPGTITFLPNTSQPE